MDKFLASQVPSPEIVQSDATLSGKMLRLNTEYQTCTPGSCGRKTYPAKHAANVNQYSTVGNKIGNRIGTHDEQQDRCSPCLLEQDLHRNSSSHCLLGRVGKTALRQRQNVVVVFVFSKPGAIWPVHMPS